MRRVSVTPSHDSARSSVSAALFAAGVDSVLEDGLSLVVFAPDEAAARALESAVRGVDPRAGVVSAAVDETARIDWSTAWRERLTAQRCGTLTVTPPWLADGLDPATTIVIEPEMAFGTGDHATTRGVLALMQGVIRPGDFVADLGAGSGILSIGAVKLGAARAAAVELDAEAIPNAESNVARNGVADRVRVIQGDAGVVLPLLAPVRVVVANIVSSVIVPLLPVVLRSLTPDGVAIFSGMLITEREGLLRDFARAGFRAVLEEREGEWWSVLCARES